MVYINSISNKTSSRKSKCLRIACTIFGGCTLIIAMCAAVGIPLGISISNVNNESNLITTIKTDVQTTQAMMTMTTSTSSITTSTTTTTTSSATISINRRIFALSQIINGQTVTCSSVGNSNPSYTECNDLQKGGLYAPNGITCTTGWNNSPSQYWSTVAFCQSFVNSLNTYIEAYYDCNTSQTRFTWSNNTWGTTNDNGYTKSLRCYY